MTTIRPTLRRLSELRRALTLTAAVLFVLALTMPVWRITFEAPQYVQTLVVELYAYPRIGGDYVEVHSLNKYVGFYYPDPVYVDPNYDVHEKAIAVPEWVLGPVAFVGTAVVAAVVSVLPEEKIQRGLAALFTGTVVVFASMAVIIQYRLYQAGHTLDPDAPLNGVSGFTPPLLGSYEVANISGNAWFGPGGYLLVAAVVLLAAAFRLRDSRATVGDVPALLRGRWRRIRDRVPGVGSGGSGNRPDPDTDPDPDDRPHLETDGGSRRGSGVDADPNRTPPNTPPHATEDPENERDSLPKPDGDPP
ncbi:hypothetical protein SAMN05444422_10139 [Halobiforma haloterrestris]|uniref:Uncharacterized protein n=1 Tax=Natronobacterium haloterrestre TaxID=148448 RepID=A0A1I1CY47_NATHA|nr:hypothetical protein [Halobiforma haloterrestris]SFB67444.1 hypothetical protein SAMN05444422_10139 [Halobiforma haloterrestris]